MKVWRATVAAATVLVGVMLGGCGGGGGGGEPQPELSGTVTVAATAEVLVAASARPTVVGPTPADLSCTLRSGQLPAGMVLGAGCAVAGTPTEIGSFDFVLTVTAAGYRGSATANVSFVVAGPTYYAAAPVDALRLEQPATAFPVARAQGGGRAGDQISFAIGSGRLPNGLTLDATTGALVGTPTELGSFELTVSASLLRNGVMLALRPDVAGRERLSLTVQAPLRTVSFGTACCEFMVAGSDSPPLVFSPPLTAGEQVVFALDNPPPGFTINPINGVVTGRSQTTDPVDFRVTALITTAQGASYTLSLGPLRSHFLGILPLYRFSSNNDQNRSYPYVNRNGYPDAVSIRTMLGSQIRFTPESVFGAAPGDVHHYELVAAPGRAYGLPAWLSIDASTGVITTNVPFDDPLFAFQDSRVNFDVRVTTVRAGVTYVATQGWDLTRN